MFENHTLKQTIIIIIIFFRCRSRSAKSNTEKQCGDSFEDTQEDQREQLRKSMQVLRQPLAS